MRNKVWLIVGALAVVIAGGVIVWLVLGAKQQSPNQNNTNNSENSAAEVVDETANDVVTVDIKDSAFTPQKLKVKKGTKVTWTNQDTVRHNVIAPDENSQSGLPTENPLLGKGESYSFTFENSGTYDYRCAPHSFMTGTVEVVE